MTDLAAEAAKTIRESLPYRCAGPCPNTINHHAEEDAEVAEIIRRAYAKELARLKEIERMYNALYR